MLVKKNFSNRLPTQGTLPAHRLQFSADRGEGCSNRSFEESDLVLVPHQDDFDRYGTQDDDKFAIQRKSKARKRKIFIRSCCGWGPYQRRRAAQLMMFFLPAVAVLLVLVLVSWPRLAGNLFQNEVTLSELPAIDFVVGGFPKCGTTTLLYALHRHEEILVPSRESCALKDTWRRRYQVWRRYQNEVRELLQDKSTTSNQTETGNVALRNARSKSRHIDRKIVTGIKCPTGIYSSNFMNRLNEVNQNYEGNNRAHPLKWIIGMRHPVWQVQSFYNYRITELYDKKVWWKDVRSLDNIMSSDEPWKDMSKFTHQYEIYLTKFLSFVSTVTSSSPYNKEIHGKTIFLYFLEQIDDTDNLRAAEFRQDLSRYLGLVTPLSMMGKENVNRFVSGPERHQEIISICDDKFKAVRRQLVIDSAATANWIQKLLRPNLTRSDDSIGMNAATQVAVSNLAFVDTILETWKHDPCT